MDFVLVSALVCLLILAVLQLALALHVRNTVADAAASGARYGALADRTAVDAADRTRVLLEGALGTRYAQDVTASRHTDDGVDTLTVQVRTPVPLLGLLGPAEGWEISGHAVVAR